QYMQRRARMQPCTLPSVLRERILPGLAMGHGSASERSVMMPLASRRIWRLAGPSARRAESGSGKLPKPTMTRICIFCGSSAGLRAVYADAARAMGQALIRRGIGLVYGGGCVGLMGTIAEAVMKGGGEVIGVIPDALVERELAHGDISQLIIVRSMHDRKAK